MQSTITENVTTWDGYAILFDGFPFHKLPIPCKYFKHEDRIAMKWGNIYCILSPFQNVTIGKNREETGEQNYKQFYRNYNEGIKILFELLC